MPSLLIAPSLLSADFGRINEEIASVDALADFLHVDVMDGHFVPNLTLGAPVVKCLKSRVPIECHLMIMNPEKYIEDFVKAGAWRVTVHWEATKDQTASILEEIRALGAGPSLSINPETPLEEIEPYLDQVDMVLIMSVHPGFGGQSFIADVLSKVTRLREFKSDLDICMDGGINAETGLQAVQAGANALVAGSYIFSAPDRAKAIASLRGLGTH
jgi:ribulose-phosphate 3-epimerase